MKKDSPRIVITGLLITTILAGFFIFRPSFLNHLDQKISDIITTFASESKTTDSRVIVVDIDEKSLQTLGQWPWPRYRIAALLKKPLDLGAKSVVVDLLFPEPDRTSPTTIRAEVKRDLQLDVELTGIPKSLEDHDRVLAHSMSGGPFILSNKFIFNKENQSNRNCRLHPIETARVADDSDKSTPKPFFRASGVVCNIELIAASTEYSGFINAIPDNDGILRRIPLLIEYNGDVFPSLALACMMQSLGTRQIMVKSGLGGLESISIDQKIIPVDAKGNLLIKHRQRAKLTDYISASDLLSDQVPKQVLTDKFVFVGTSAAGLADNFQIPNGLRVPGVEIHAATTANIIDADFISKPSVIRVWELLLVLFAGIISSVMPTRFGGIHCGIGTVALAGGIWAGSVLLFKTNGILFSPLFPILILMLNYSVLISLRYWLHERVAVATTQNTLVQLKESRGRLDSIVKTIPDVVYRLDRFGRISFINDAVTQYGYRPENLVGTEVIDLIAPDDRNGALYRINERRTGSRATKGFELRLRVKNQAVAPIEEGWRHFVIAAEGLYNSNLPQTENFIGTQGIARDINESKVLQRQLLQAQKMEAIGALAGGIAHDFNNLLMGIQGNTSLLLADIDSEHPHFEGIKNIETHVTDAANLTNQLLGVARKSQLDITPIDINETVKQSATLFGRTRKEISIYTKYDPTICSVEVDRGQIEQVLLNLFINAWQAMPDGGELFINTDIVFLDGKFLKPYALEAGDFVKVSIIDTGIGMDEQTIERLFEPFYTTKEMGHGTGLGLASAYGIIQNHKGFIDVNSKKGHGSQFNIYLPASKKAPIKRKKHEAELITGSETILLVDDERMILDLGQSLLNKLGYQVLIAEGGRAAIEAYRNNPGRIDMVILDMTMPDMGGEKTYTQLKSINPDIKVLLSSGYSQDGRVQKLIDLGCNGFIRKPFGFSYLSQKVRDVLDGTLP